MRRTASLAAVAIILLISCVTPTETPEDRLSVLYPEDRPFPESRFATVGDLQIHYRAWEPPNTPRAKILLLHGIGSSTFSFEQVVPGLVDAGYAVVAVDLPGFGYSDTALKFEHTPENRLAIIWTLIDRLDTDQNQFNPVDQWFVIGHEMGGELALWMAADRPGRIAGLVLVSTVAGSNRPGGRMAALPPVRWGLRSWLANSLYTADGVRELLEDAYGQPPTQEEVNGYLAPLLRKDMDKALVRYARTVGTEIPPLNEITAPVLAVWGDRDTWRSIDEGREQLAELQDATMEIIEGAGHVPMDTHPARFVEIVDRWITAQTLRNL
jgi:pimeloyl-ACP methyl ester carboxylesterase